MRRRFLFAAAAMASMGALIGEAQPVGSDHARKSKPLTVGPPEAGAGQPHQGEREMARRRRQMAKKKARIGQN